MVPACGHVLHQVTPWRKLARGWPALVLGLACVGARPRVRDDIEQRHYPRPDPIVTYVDYEAEARSTVDPKRLPYPKNGFIPKGYTVKEKRLLWRWLPGLLIVGVLPLGGVALARTTSMDSAWIPVAGPFMAMGEYKPMKVPESPFFGLEHLAPVFADGFVYTMLGIGGGLQAAGWGLLGYSLLTPDRRYLVREDLAKSYFVPAPVPGGFGLNWVGTF